MKSEGSSINVAISLAGGFGNQLFQMANAIANFGIDNVELESNFGNPKKASAGIPEVALLEFGHKFSLKEEYVPNFWKRKMYNGILRICGRSGGHLTRLNRYLIRIISISFLFGTQKIGKLYVEDAIIWNRERGQALSMGYFQGLGFANDKSVIDFMRGAHIPNLGQDAIELSSQILRTNPVIFHLRLGDYLNERKIGIPSPEYFRNGIQFFENIYPDTEIWLVTNDLERAQNYLGDQIYGKLVVDRKLNNLPALELFEVMRNARRFIISNSTFSWWAAFLSHHETKVVAPDPWFRDLGQSSNLIPVNWHLIKN